MGKNIKVTVWNENLHEKTDKKVAEAYPQGIHGAISGFLSGEPGLEVRIATLDQPEHGLARKYWHLPMCLYGGGIWPMIRLRTILSIRFITEFWTDGLIVLHSGHFPRYSENSWGPPVT